MKIFAAIDLKNGKCVRLAQGNPEAATVYGNDPAAMAAQWEAIGTDWLHVVNLDGAFGNPQQAAKNSDALRAILERVTTPVQFGGGLRSRADVAHALKLGARRVVIGSVAANHPNQMLSLLDEFGPERIVLGLDVRENKVATHGWRETATIEASHLLEVFLPAGLIHVVHTDISRDGMLTGANVAASVALAQAGQVQVIVSGGVAGLADIERAKAAETQGIEGVIIGKALYTGAVDLAEAMRVAHAPLV
jgi:phosphoribosylformimino-5-aminoimidazole carboxamide ribotide isomerase